MYRFRFRTYTHINKARWRNMVGAADLRFASPRGSGGSMPSRATTKLNYRKETNVNP
jgi:hypothetical protein